MYVQCTGADAVQAWTGGGFYKLCEFLLLISISPFILCKPPLIHSKITQLSAFDSLQSAVAGVDIESSRAVGGNEAFCAKIFCFFI